MCLLLLLLLFIATAIAIGFVLLDGLKTAQRGTIIEKIDGIFWAVFGAAMVAFIGLLLYDVYLASL